MESQIEDTNQSITFNESIILKKDESKPSNKLWHLKSKNHNSISFPAGISASLHDMITSIKKTKFQSNTSSKSILQKPSEDTLDSYLKNDT